MSWELIFHWIKKEKRERGRRRKKEGSRVAEKKVEKIPAFQFLSSIPFVMSPSRLVPLMKKGEKLRKQGRVFFCLWKPKWYFFQFLFHCWILVFFCYSSVIDLFHSKSYLNQRNALCFLNSSTRTKYPNHWYETVWPITYIQYYARIRLNETHQLGCRSSIFFSFFTSLLWSIFPFFSFFRPTPAKRPLRLLHGDQGAASH